MSAPSIDTVSGPNAFTAVPPRSPSSRVVHMRAPSTAESLLTALALLRGGASFVKYAFGRGAPAERFVRLVDDDDELPKGGALVWSDPKKQTPNGKRGQRKTNGDAAAGSPAPSPTNGASPVAGSPASAASATGSGEKSLLLSSVTDIYCGRLTRAFQKEGTDDAGSPSGSSHADSVCLSLRAGERTLDLATPSAVIRDQWASSIARVLKAIGVTCRWHISIHSHTDPQHELALRAQQTLALTSDPINAKDPREQARQAASDLQRLERRVQDKEAEISSLKSAALTQALTQASDDSDRQALVERAKQLEQQHAAQIERTTEEATARAEAEASLAAALSQVRELQSAAENHAAALLAATAASDSTRADEATSASASQEGIAQLQQALVDSKAEATRIRDSTDELLAASKAEAVTLQQSVADALAEAARLQQSLADAQTESATLQQTASDAQAEVERLKQSAAVLDTSDEIARLQQSLAEAQAESARLQRTVTSEKELCASLEDDLNFAERASAEAADEIASLKQQVVLYQNSVPVAQAADTAARAAAAATAAATQAAQTAQNQVAQLQKSLAAERSTNATLEEDLSDAETAMRKAQAEVASLTKQVKALEAEVAAMDEELNEKDALLRQTATPAAAESNMADPTPASSEVAASSVTPTIDPSIAAAATAASAALVIELRAQLLAAEEQLEELSSELNEREALDATAAEAKDAATKRQGELEAQLLEVQAEVASLEAKLAASTKEAHEHASAAADLIQARTTHAAALAALTATHSEALTALEATHASAIATSSSEHAAAIEALEATHAQAFETAASTATASAAPSTDELKTEHAQALADLAAAHATKLVAIESKHSEQVATLTTRATTNADQLSEAQQALTEARAQLLSASSEAEVARSAFSALEERMANQIEEAAAELAEARTQMATSASEAEDARTALTIVEGRMLELETELAELQLQPPQVEVLVPDSSGSLLDTSAELATLHVMHEQELADLKAQVIDLEERLALVLDAPSPASIRRSRCSSSADSPSSPVGRLEKELTSLRVILSTQIQQHLEDEAAMEVLREREMELEAKLAALQHQATILEAARADMANHNLSLAAELSRSLRFAGELELGLARETKRAADAVEAKAELEAEADARVVADLAAREADEHTAIEHAAERERASDLLAATENAERILALQTEQLNQLIATHALCVPPPTPSTVDEPTAASIHAADLARVTLERDHLSTQVVALESSLAALAVADDLRARANAAGAMPGLLTVDTRHSLSNGHRVSPSLSSTSSVTPRSSTDGTGGSIPSAIASTPPVRGHSRHNSSSSLPPMTPILPVVVVDTPPASLRKTPSGLKPPSFRSSGSASAASPGGSDLPHTPSTPTFPPSRLGKLAPPSPSVLDATAIGRPALKKSLTPPSAK